MESNRNLYCSYKFSREVPKNKNLGNLPYHPFQIRIYFRRLDISIAADYDSDGFVLPRPAQVEELLLDFKFWNNPHIDCVDSDLVYKPGSFCIYLENAHWNFCFPRRMWESISKLQCIRTLE